MKQNISITTDYCKDTGDPEPYLKRISGAGFTHVHWCHEWDTDFVYSESEINKIMDLLEKYNLKVLDIHASEGKENNWISKDELKRKVGVELVKNRIYMANKLSCDAIVLHFKREPDDRSEKQKYWEILNKSLNELKTHAQKYKVRIALENYGNEDSEEIKKLFSEYDSDFIGLCYDSGHGNMGNGVDVLKELKDRLVSIHLHDNDGKTDQHKLLFSGNIDWDRLAKILASSSYKKCINLEVHIKNSGISDESVFLSKAHDGGLKFSKMVQDCSK